MPWGLGVDMFNVDKWICCMLKSGAKVRNCFLFASFFGKIIFMAFCKLLVTRYHVGIKSMIRLRLFFYKNDVYLARHKNKFFCSRLEINVGFWQKRGGK